MPIGLSSWTPAAAMTACISSCQAMPAPRDASVSPTRSNMSTCQSRRNSMLPINRPATEPPMTTARRLALAGGGMVGRAGSVLDVGIGIEQLSRLVLVGPDDHFLAGFLELLEIIALDALRLGVDHPRFRPFAVGAE